MYTTVGSYPFLTALGVVNRKDLAKLQANICFGLEAISKEPDALQHHSKLRVCMLNILTLLIYFPMLSRFSYPSTLVFYLSNYF